VAQKTTKKSTKAVTPPPKAEETSQKSSAFVPLVMGGIVAAALGFGAAYFLTTQNAKDMPPMDVSAMADNTSKIEALRHGMPTKDDISELMTTQKSLSEHIKALDADLQTLKDRLNALEEISQTPSTVLDEELVERLEATLKDQEARLDILNQGIADRETAVAKQDIANQQASLIYDIREAINMGADFSNELVKLTKTGINLPEILNPNGDQAVVSLEQLKAEFPDIARKILLIERANEETASLSSFIRKQLGSRSLTPKEGDDPDAILSRVEAALALNQLQDVLDEVKALSAKAQDVMSPWIERVMTRIKVLDALETLKPNAN